MHDENAASVPDGDDDVRAMMPAMYEELRALAGAWFASQPADHTLQPTALVHEAYLRLARGNAEWESRAHFSAVAAMAMRQILVDVARRRHAEKRGANWRRVTLSGVALPGGEESVDVVALHEALERLEALNERHCRIVELRFFGGLGVEETARILGVSPRTVKYDWRMARAWLLEQLS